ncbi:MAG TPA: hypothetical protein VF875_16325 [Anaeromyxobacter sp.]
MPRPRDPSTPRRPTAKDLERERARANGARRLLPWALLSALSGGAIGYVAGGGVRGAVALVAVGLGFSLFLWATSVPRCPACGARLRRRARGEPTPSGAETCAQCRTRFE